MYEYNANDWPLWAILEDRDLSLRAFAAAMKVSENLVYRLRMASRDSGLPRSQRLPSPRFRRRAARLLGLPEAVLFAGLPQTIARLHPRPARQALAS